MESLGYHTEDRILLDGDAWDRLTLGDEPEENAYTLQGEVTFHQFESGTYVDSYVERLRRLGRRSDDQ